MNIEPVNEQCPVVAAQLIFVPTPLVEPLNEESIKQELDFYLALDSELGNVADFMG